MADAGDRIHAGQTRPGLVLSPLKLAWLTEIGLDVRSLAKYRAPEPPSLSESRSPSEQATAPQAKPASGRMHISRQPTPSVRRTPQADRVAPPTTPVSLPSTLQGLEAHAQACTACELHQQRDQVVFGAGDTDQPEWLIVGEAPGQADDRSGLPFQGKAGQLLHAMLLSIGVHPSTVALGPKPQPVPAWSQPVSAYFSNLVKCRPLGNHSPDAAHIASCVPLLQAQIDLLRPRRILALGRLAAQALLQTSADIPELRDRVHYLTSASGHRIPLVVTWHPASLLVHPRNKVQAWADLTLAMQAV